MNTHRTDLIVCPYCEHVHPDSHEKSKQESEMYCESCSQNFALLIEVKRHYTTTAIRICGCTDCDNCKPDGRCCCHQGECVSLHEELEYTDDRGICMCIFCGAEMHLFNGSWVRHDDAEFDRALARINKRNKSIKYHKLRKFGR